MWKSGCEVRKAEQILYGSLILIYKWDKSKLTRPHNFVQAHSWQVVQYPAHYN